LLIRDDVHSNPLDFILKAQQFPHVQLFFLSFFNFGSDKNISTSNTISKYVAHKTETLRDLTYNKKKSRDNGAPSVSFGAIEVSKQDQREKSTKTPMFGRNGTKVSRFPKGKHLKNISWWFQPI